MLSKYGNQGNLSTSTVSTRNVRRIFNVKDYGAIGDGVNNDTTAIQKAINNAQNSRISGDSGRGASVWFPSGIYFTTATLKVQTNNISLLGAGQGSTVIYPNFSNGDVLLFGNGDSLFSNLEFSDIQIFAPSARNNGAHINIKYCSNVRINNFSMNNPVIGISIGDSVYPKGSSNIVIRNGTINNIKNAVGDGIRIASEFGGASYTNIFIGPNIIMTNPPAAKPYSGINVAIADGLSIYRNNITSVKHGIVLAPGAGDTVMNVHIDHTLFDSCGDKGLWLNGVTATSKILGLMSTNSWFSGDSNGIYTSGVAGAVISSVSFIGARILNNRKDGVSHNYGNDLSFTDCTISGNGQTTSNTYYGINVATAVDGWSVVNCRIGRTGTASSDTIGRQKAAINIASGRSNNFSIIGNDVSGNGTQPFILNSSTYGYGQMIHSNYPNYGAPGGRASIAAASAGIADVHTSIVGDTLAPNRLVAGSTFRVWAWGTRTASAAASDSFMVRIGTAPLTGTVVAAVSPALGQPCTAAPFKVEAFITCRTAGAAGTFYGMAEVRGDTVYFGSSAGINRFVKIGNQGLTTINTTTPLLIELTYRSTSASSTNTFQGAGIDNVKV